MNAINEAMRRADEPNVIDIESKRLYGEPRYRIGNLIDSQRNVLKDLIDKRVRDEAVKNDKLRALDDDFDHKVAQQEDRIAGLLNTLADLQHDVTRMKALKQDRRAEIEALHKENDAALEKMIRAQKMVLAELEKE